MIQIQGSCIFLKINNIMFPLFVLFFSALNALVIPDNALLGEMLASMQPEPSQLFGFDCTNRTYWEDPRRNVRIQAHIAAAKTYASTPFPPWNDTLYFDFRKTGNREPGEKMMNSRSDRFVIFALAECYHNIGNYTDLINNELEAIANQKSWSWPAHGMIFINTH